MSTAARKSVPSMTPTGKDVNDFAQIAISRGNQADRFGNPISVPFPAECNPFLLRQPGTHNKIR